MATRGDGLQRIKALKQNVLRRWSYAARRKGTMNLLAMR